MALYRERRGKYRSKEEGRTTGERKIIAVDFDGTIVEDKWPYIGKEREEVTSKMKVEHDNGTYIIIWTCRSGECLADMIDWLDMHNVHYDRINANAPWILDKYKRDSRKIYADEYIDDRAVKI